MLDSKTCVIVNIHPARPTDVPDLVQCFPSSPCPHSKTSPWKTNVITARNPSPAHHVFENTSLDSGTSESPEDAAVSSGGCRVGDGDDEVGKTIHVIVTRSKR